MLRRAVHLFYGSSLFTLPWIGLGLVSWLTGVDIGAGLQPSWLLLALAVVLVASVQVKRLGAAAALVDFWSGIPSCWRMGAGLAVLAVLVSGSGLLVARVQEPVWIVGSRYLRQVIQLVVMGFFVLWPALWTRGVSRWSWTIRLLLISALVQAGYGLLQGVSFYHSNWLYPQLERVFTSNPAILSGSCQLYLGNVFRDVPRLRGTACEPLYLGNYLLMVMPWIWVAGQSGRKRGIAGLVLGLLLLGTWSRGAWLGFLVQAVTGVILVFRVRRVRPGDCSPARIPGSNTTRWLFGSLMVLLLGLGLALGPEALLMPLERVLQSFSRLDWSNLTRFYSMQAAWRAFSLSPWVGVGWGQFAWHFPVLADPMGLQSQFDWPMVNNFPLQILCETGVLGFLVFLGSAVGLGRAVLLRLHDPDRSTQMVIPAALAVVGVWTQLLTFSQYNLPHVWVALGLLLAALRDDSLPCRGPNRGMEAGGGPSVSAGGIP